MKVGSKLFLNTGLLNTAITAAFVLNAAASAAATIIAPGQCITVGGTEVCASTPTREQCDQLKAQSRSDTIFSCRYDHHPTAETRGLKTYAVVRSTVTNYGQQVTTVVKDYGLTDKEACEKDAEGRNRP